MKLIFLNFSRFKVILILLKDLSQMYFIFTNFFQNYLYDCYLNLSEIFSANSRNEYNDEYNDIIYSFYISITFILF